MDSISNDIKELYSQSVSKVGSPLFSGASYSESSLGKSASKKVKTQDRQVNILKKSIKSSLKPKKEENIRRLKTLSDSRFYGNCIK